MYGKPTIACVIVAVYAVLLSGCDGIFVRPDGPTVSSRMAQAKALYREERFDRARKTFQELSDADTYDIECAEEATFYLAECCYRQKRYVEAHEAYCRLLSRFRTNRYFDIAVQREFIIGANYCTGHAADFWHRRGFGAKILVKALDYQPFGEYSARARLILGNYYFDIGNYDNALGEYDLLITKYSDTDQARRARYRRALCLYNMLEGNRYDSAQLRQAITGLQDAENAEKEQPKSKAGAGRLSEIRRKLNELREAGARENYDLARFFLKNGNKKAAAIYFQEVLEDAPDSPYAQLAQRELDGIVEEINQ